MSRESLVFIIGILLFLTPFLGIPVSLKENVMMAGGFVLILLGYWLRRAAYLRSISRETGERRTDAFVEHPAPRHREGVSRAEERAFDE